MRPRSPSKEKATFLSVTGLMMEMSDHQVEKDILHLA